MGYLEFKNKLVNDIMMNENNINIQKLKTALDDLPYLLERRDTCDIFIKKDIFSADMIIINYISKQIWCKTDCTDSGLTIATVIPNWYNICNKISTSYRINEILSYIIYQYMEYIQRSLVENLIGAVSVSYGISGSNIGDYIFRHGPSYIIKDINSFIKTIDMDKIKHNTKYRTFEYIMNKINALDPFVNRLVFYYNKSLRLFRETFEEEAIIALDNCIDIICQSIKKNDKLPTMHRKNMHLIIKNKLDLNESSIEQMNSIYKLRCDFSAHPSKNLWWDFYEKHNDQFEILMSTITCVFIKFLQYENDNRNIEKYPTTWSSWFFKYCDSIFDYII